jgi:predicted kinase
VAGKVATSDNLAVRLERGELTRAEADAAGRALADRHERARSATPPGPAATALERRLTASFHELLAVVEQRGEIERVLALERFAHAFVVARAQTLNARVRRGRTRRLSHELDVADDLARLVLELVERGGDRYARALVRGYRDAGGDPGDDALIAFYAAQRAAALAKIDAVRAAEYPARSAAHGHHSARARDLLSLAERFAWQARMPLVIVVCGVEGSGKTRLADALSSRSQLAHLSADVTRRRLGPRTLEHLDAADVDLLTYGALGRRAARYVAARGGAIADGRFCRRTDRDAFVATLAGVAKPLYVQCHAPAAERAPWEPLDEVAPHAHLVLRTDRRVEDVIGDLLALLDQRVGLGGP